MKYKYDVVTLNLTEEQMHMSSIGIAQIEEINAIICELVNERSKDGWEALYPFSVPQVWFRKEVKAYKRPLARKKTAKKTRQSTRN